MKKIIYIAAAAAMAISLASCEKFLDTTNYWSKTAEDVPATAADAEALVTGIYNNLNVSIGNNVHVNHFLWSEAASDDCLGGGGNNDQTMQAEDLMLNFGSDMYNTFYVDRYKGVARANMAIASIGNVEELSEARKNQLIGEAYFLRAYCYLILVKNFKEVPLVLQAYVNDEASFDLAKSSEAEIIAQIKEDVKTALATGAAKGTFEEDWATKGRATKWALYALMADACLWSEDYDQCIEYCNMILNANDAFRPVFMTNTNDWYTMFYPGNSNESIFELNWDYSQNQTNNFNSLFTLNVSTPLRPTARATEMMKQETQTLKDNGLTEDGRMGRMLLATYVPDNGQVNAWAASNQYYIWKYYGTDVPDITGGARAHQDANFIIYRVADVMLMKALALTMKGENNWMEAVSLINRVRNRAALDNFRDIDLQASDAQAQIDQLGELTIIEEILNQREMEFMAEAKRWYDLLWFGRVANGKYKTQFISKVMEGNQTTNSQWIQSVLQDENAWYMPIPQADIEHNKLLEQNPYYSSSK